MTTHDQIRDQFSLAYDNELEPTQKQGFDAHMLECAECRDAYAQYKEALDLVHAQPLVSIPKRVVLPVDVELTSGWWRRFLTGRGIATGVGVVAAAAILLVATHTQSTPGSQGTAVVPQVQGTPHNNAALSSPSGQAPNFAQAQGCFARTVQGVAVAVSRPANFNVSSTKSVGGTRAQITVSTQSSSVAPGQQVQVFASAQVTVTQSGPSGTTPSPPLMFQPCVGFAGGAPQWQTVDASGVTSVTIPATLHSGDRVDLEALVPAGSGGYATVPELQATLTLTVS